MDSQDNTSDNSLEFSSSNSNQTFSNSLRNSSASSSNGQSSHGQQNIEQIDRFEENTIGFDTISDFSNNPLDQAILRDEDSFYSEYKSLYSNRSKSRFNDFSNSIDQQLQDENRYDSNSFSSYYSFSSKTPPNPNQKKGSRDRSREKSKRESKEELSFQLIEGLNPPHSKRMEAGFKKRK